jgi:hypothetical protein
MRALSVGASIDERVRGRIGTELQRAFSENTSTDQMSVRRFGGERVRSGRPTRIFGRTATRIFGNAVDAAELMGSLGGALHDGEVPPLSAMRERIQLQGSPCPVLGRQG